MRSDYFTNQDFDPDLVAAFTHAVARSGSNALLLTADNKADGFVPIDEA